MAAPFRIERSTDRDDANPDFKEYLGRLLKLIPAEVVGIFMIGKGFIPNDQIYGHWGWVVVCLVLIIVVRIYGTADPENNKPFQKVPVVLSTIAFLIWIYWLGGTYIQKVHLPWLASLLVLICSFLVPYFYKGPKES